jgi:hypothetical protein
MENVMRIYKPTWASLREYSRARVGDNPPPYTRIVSEVVNNADRRKLSEQSMSVLLRTQLTKKAFESCGKEIMGTSVVRSSFVQVFLWPLACKERLGKIGCFQEVRLRQLHLWRSWMNSWNSHQSKFCDLSMSLDQSEFCDLLFSMARNIQIWGWQRLGLCVGPSLLGWTWV